MANVLKILSWNSNGLSQHQLELQTVLDIENIDVCLISETHFTKHSFIRFKGYKVYHTILPDNSARGGTAIIIKETIHHCEMPKYSTQEIQLTAVEIRTHRHSILVAAIYSPPRHNIKKTNI